MDEALGRRDTGYVSPGQEFSPLLLSVAGQQQPVSGEESLYARRRVGGVGSAALPTLDFAAAVVVGAVRHSVHSIVDLLNAIRAAEPDSSRQRGLLGELKNYCEQASERDT